MKLTEKQLNNIITEAVKKVLKENDDTHMFNYDNAMSDKYNDGNFSDVLDEINQKYNTNYHYNDVLQIGDSNLIIECAEELGYDIEWVKNELFEMINTNIKILNNTLNSLNNNVNEAIRGELGMSKDERINRRIDNYMEDYPDMEYGDTIYPELGEKHREKINRNRLNKHYKNHPKHKGLKYQIDEE